MQYSNDTIELLMHQFKPVLGADCDKYKNHVYRVFLNCLLMDNEKNNEEKYAIATVFHDIGIWTNSTFDYLDSSIEQVKIYLSENNKQDWVAEISLMIYWHHKMSKYEGENKSIVETFRKADWIDLSLGLLTYGFDKKKIKTNSREFPNLGFHIFLIKETMKNFFKHPFNPLPMYKK
jgi:hypothetical protein